ncbi:MAG: conjugal transfer protein TraF, partial [Thermodesulfobacteriota bacterium]|nr:conjugal transfer protein TraF [Thermodesulfobacteriota bacterium]
MRGLSIKAMSRLLLCLFFSLSTAVSCVAECKTGTCFAHEAEETIKERPDDPRKSSGTETIEKPVYSQGKVGWYWYETKPKKPEPEKEEKQKQKPGKIPKSELTVDNYSYDQLWNMYPDEFQKLFKRTTKTAVQSPTEKNVINHLLMQDIARRKSMAFASVVGYVGQKYPQFSNADVHPTVVPGRQALAQVQYDEINRTIAGASNEFALIMFTQSGCRFCDTQQAILKFFTNNYNWTVRIIDINEHQGAAAKFGIEQTPSTILIHKGSQDYMPVSSGIISAKELKHRVFR